MPFPKTLQITIPKTIKKTSDLIAVDRGEWDHLHKLIAELEHAVRVIAEGEREWRAGKTRRVASLKSLL